MWLFKFPLNPFNSYLRNVRQILVHFIILKNSRKTKKREFVQKGEKTYIRYSNRSTHDNQNKK
jgi:hypothetical protein